MHRSHRNTIRPARLGLRALTCALGVAGVLALPGCLSQGQQQSLVPPARPASFQVPQAPSAASAELRQYYRVLQQDLQTRGLLRTDGGGPDTPYDAEDLARNFEAIAFYSEYAGRTGGTALGMSRWNGPVRITAEFGPSVPPGQRANDTAVVKDYATRLARVTGHEISAGNKRGNFHVLFASKDDAEFLARRVRELLPSAPQSDIDLFVNPPRNFACFVLAGGTQSNPNSYVRAVALIRAEHPDLIRQSCVHEEIAQGLGLRNDSPRARPSIFNDDDEFAYLTSHDEKLLQMLYDPSLSPDMTVDEARPILHILAREKMGLSL